MMSASLVMHRRIGIWLIKATIPRSKIPIRSVQLLPPHKNRVHPQRALIHTQSAVRDAAIGGVSAAATRQSNAESSIPPQQQQQQKLETQTEHAKPAKRNTLVENNETAFQETSVINEQFPESDENGSSSTSEQPPLKIAISQKAARQLNKLMKDDQNQNLALQVSVESGGCHGFQYHLKLIDLLKDKVISKNLNDSSLAALKAEDLVDDEVSVFVRDGAKVVLDNPSLQVLRESKIDYVKELIGTSFKVIDSPYTKSACGCGSSFDVDFSKLS